MGLVIGAGVVVLLAMLLAVVLLARRWKIHILEKTYAQIVQEEAGEAMMTTTTTTAPPAAGDATAISLEDAEADDYLTEHADDTPEAALIKQQLDQTSMQTVSLDEPPVAATAKQ